MRLDSTHVVLEKIRVMLNLLRKSNIFSESSQRENPLLTKFKDLQNFARHSTTGTPLDPLEVVMPFLLILRAPNTTGPFKLAVLDALQYFMNCDALHDCPGRNSGTTALNELIDAVIKCKFVQSDELGDEVLQLQIVQTLRCVINNPVRRFLTNATMWQFLEFGFNLLITTGRTVSSCITLHQEGERMILESMRYIIQCSRASGGANNMVDDSSSIPIQVSNKRNNDPLGLPCLLTCLAYLLNVLKRRIDQHRSSSSSVTGVKSSTSSPLAVSSRPSTGSLMDMLNQDSDTLHLVFSLKALQALIMLDGSSELFRCIFVESQQFYRLIVDSLTSHLFTLASLRDCYPPVVLRLVLSLFGSLCNAIGPSIGVLLECFFRDVYTKALFQTHSVFSSEVAYHGSLDHIIAPHYVTAVDTGTSAATSAPKAPGTPKTPGTAGSSTTPSGYQLGQTTAMSLNFKVDELEMIMESLNDLLSEASLIPSLFISFDCNPAKRNLLQPMIQLISSCSRIVLNSGSEELGSFRHLGVLLVQSFKQIMRSFECRRALCEKQAEYPVPVQPPSSCSTNSAQKRDKIATSNEEKTLDSSNNISPLVLQQYFKALRIAKSYMWEAALLFAQKPSAGIKFLQQCGALGKDETLLPAHMVVFLRTTPGIPKDVVGSYLGEMGKDGDLCHKCDRKDFHAEVLVRYVEEFEFGGHSLLTCMRIFLSVFRLPGEAQQIDRILVAFSERCHSLCNEGLSGVLENAEVTYLLCFSIIMLNTDRHNPNIRQDRKMTLEQFIRNNINYGKDVNQTKPLPREFLENIYQAISEQPIRTEPDDMSAIITEEVLMDMQLQSRANYRNSVWVSSGHHVGLLHSLRPVVHAAHNAFNGNSSRLAANDSPLLSSISSLSRDSEDIHSLAMFIGKTLLCASSSPNSGTFQTPPPPCPFDLCVALAGRHWCVDNDLFECLYREMLVVGMGVFLSNHSIMTSKLAIEKEVSYLDHITEDLQARHDALPRERTGRLLQLSNDFLLDIIKLSSYYNMDHVLDLSILLLMEFSGILKSNASRIFFHGEGLNCYRGVSVETEEFEELLASYYAEMDEPANFIYCLSYFASTRHALSTLLQLIQCYHPSISNWALVWHLFGALRDAALIPPDLVLESDSDSLPQNVRHEFELKLLELDAKIINDNRPLRPAATPKKTASLLSLQGLGEALFGGNSSDNVAEAGLDPSSTDTQNRRKSSGGLVLIAPDDSVNEARAIILEASQSSNLNPYNFPSARWDAGYEYDVLSSSKNKSKADTQTQSTKDAKRTAKDDQNKHNNNSSSFYDAKSSSRTNASHGNEGKTHAELRMLVSGSSFSQLFSDTKFIPEQNLIVFLTSLIHIVEAKGCGNEGLSKVSAVTVMPSGDKNSKTTTEVRLIDDVARRRNQVLDLAGETRQQLTAIGSLTWSSAAWLEMLLVEVSLSNRDRFGVVWPLLKTHFSKVLGGSTVSMSYLSERRLVGLLKISTRMISREQYAETILELLGQLLTRVVASPPFTSSEDVRPTDLENGEADSNTQSATLLLGAVEMNDQAQRTGPGVVAMRPELLAVFANQIAAAIWRLLTLNVDLLPLLPLGQWQSLFGIIAATATTGSYAAMKSFETMAWLLHEPRLIAKVPVFCIVSIKPLLHNHEAPLSVSIGAVHLLTHLHSRLEVLIKDEEASSVTPVTKKTSIEKDSKQGLASEDPRDADYDDSDTPVLWESCWVPVLKALSEGANDSRSSVRRACVVALCQCIQDKHSDAVPTSVLVDILGNVLSPVIIKLANKLQKQLRDLVPENTLTIDGLADDNATAAAPPPSRKPPLPAATGSQQQRGTNIVGALLRSASSKEQTPCPGGALLPEQTQSDIAVCIGTFHTVFLSQLRRLAAYPSFDRLWLRLLYILGYFIGNTSATPYGIDCRLLGLIERGALPLDGSVPSLGAVADLQVINELATVTLDSLVARLKAESIFQIRDGLWFVTKETIKQFRHFSDFSSAE